MTEYERGWRAAVEQAAEAVEYYSAGWPAWADMPGLVRLLACPECRGIAMYDCPTCTRAGCDMEHLCGAAAVGDAGKEGP
jgi:hypothetical protein